MADYLPHRESELLAWSTSFALVINEIAAQIGLTVQQATNYQTLHDAFATAYAVTQGPNRGPAATQTKNTAKEALIRGPGGIRQLVGIIQKHPATTDTQRVELNINVPDVEPAPVPQPTEPPEMDIMGVFGRTVRIRIHNDTILQRKKPEGVAGASVFSYVGDVPPDEIKDWDFEFNTSKTLFDVMFDSDVPAGSKVWFTAFWFNRKMESGPACEPDSTHIAGGLREAA